MAVLDTDFLQCIKTDKFNEYDPSWIKFLPSVLKSLPICPRVIDRLNNLVYMSSSFSF